MCDNLEMARYIATILVLTYKEHDMSYTISCESKYCSYTRLFTTSKKKVKTHQSKQESKERECK